MTSADALITPALLRALSPQARGYDARPLTGGVSAQVVALDLHRHDGTTEALVVRHRPADAAGDGVCVAQEYALMQALCAAGLPVPRPRLLWSRDVMVMARVEGTTALPADAPRQLAALLARVHAQPPPPDAALPPREDPAEAIAQTLGLDDPTRVREALRGAPAVLLHGDPWPGNLLWRDGQLVAALDWEDAAVGDPCSDLACARLELEVAAGRPVSDAMLDHYLRLTRLDSRRLALWEVYVADAALGAMHAWGLCATELAHRRAVTEASRQRAMATLRA